MEFKPIKQQSYYERPLPVNYSDKDRSRFEGLKICTISRASIHLYERVTIYQYFLLKRFSLLDEYCMPPQKRSYYSQKHFVRAFFMHKRVIEKGIWITDLWSDNYFHWILECLPRLIVLKEAKIQLPLIIPEKFLARSFIRQSLDELEVDTISYSMGEAIMVKKLFVIDNDTPCEFDKTYISRLRDTFFKLDGLKPKAAQRLIYISRKGAKRRRIVNEEQVEDLLKLFGFETIYCESLSFHQQRQLMRETKVLISNHGAGLTNLIFLPDNSKVIELHPDTERYNSCFYHLTASIPLHYYYLFANATSPDPQKADVTVDCLQLSKIINDVLDKT